MTKKLRQLLIDENGSRLVFIGAPAAKRGEPLEVVSVGNPLIINVYRPDYEATKKAVYEHAPGQANAYVFGTPHPSHLDYHPIQYFKVLNLKKKLSSHKIH